MNKSKRELFELLKEELAREGVAVLSTSNNFDEIVIENENNSGSHMNVTAYYDLMQFHSHGTVLSTIVDMVKATLKDLEDGVNK